MAHPLAVPSESNGPHPSPDHNSVQSFPHQAGKIFPSVPPRRGTAVPSDTMRCERAASWKLRFWGGRDKKYRKIRKPSECREKGPPTRRMRPRWYLCTLGSVWVPATTDMREIRRRKRVAEPVSDVGGRTWWLLRLLICTGRKSSAAADAVGHRRR